ncbi:hypothetical protein DL769_009729 [Monosporascus sp. CRB-8-3]|nr:hypothetical protein DL769_009729 [Monosporascus sp. CRB-8-3]
MTQTVEVPVRERETHDVEVVGENDAEPPLATFENDLEDWKKKGTAGDRHARRRMDSVVHTAEEVRDASKTPPRSMIWTTVVNGAVGFVMLITFCSVLGSLEDTLASPTQHAFLYVFYNSTQYVAGASVLGALVITMTIFTNLSVTAASSRQLYAFARDHGVPFSKTFAYVPPKWGVPMNAICLSFAVSCLLSLINLGSSVAFMNIAFLSTAVILGSYMVAISCCALKRVRGELLLPSKFKPGRAGLPINIASIIFLIAVFVCSFFPWEQTLFLRI